jgi:hypothetical protein
MKIGVAHRTQSSSLYSANTIGAPMYPAPIGVADQTQTKKLLVHSVWSALPIGAGDMGAPILYIGALTHPA